MCRDGSCAVCALPIEQARERQRRGRLRRLHVAAALQERLGVDPLTAGRIRDQLSDDLVLAIAVATGYGGRDPRARAVGDAIRGVQASSSTALRATTPGVTYSLREDRG
jgi:hypothetical protein